MACLHHKSKPSQTSSEKWCGTLTKLKRPDIPKTSDINVLLHQQFQHHYIHTTTYSGAKRDILFGFKKLIIILRKVFLLQLFIFYLFVMAFITKRSKKLGLRSNQGKWQLFRHFVTVFAVLLN